MRTGRVFSVEFHADARYSDRPSVMVTAWSVADVLSGST